MFPAKKTSICSGKSQPWGDRRVNQQYWWLFPSRKTCCFFVQAAGVKSEHRITMPFTVIKRSISVGFLASGWSLTGEFRVRHLRPTELIQRFWVAEIVHTQTRYLMRFFNADFHATCSAFTGGCARHGDVSVPTGSSAIERHTSHHPCILVKPQKPTWSAVLHWWEGQVQDGLTVFFLQTCSSEQLQAHMEAGTFQDNRNHKLYIQYMLQQVSGKKGFQSMCFNQQVSSVDRNLHGYGSEPFSPSDSPKHEQTSLTILSLVLIH